MKKSILIMEGGVIQYWDIPEGQEITLRDYDIYGVEEDLKVDESGDYYQEIILKPNGICE
ncbi:MAG: hypothetical protein ACOC1K_05670 [Nanoarchaeota archaeon]